MPKTITQVRPDNRTKTRESLKGSNLGTYSDLKCI